MMHLVLYTCVAIGIVCSSTLFVFLRKRASSRRSIPRTLLQLSLSLGVAFVIAELCVRLAMAILVADDANPTSFDAELGWSRPPRNRVQTSDHASVEKDPRIVFAGDSVAFGQGVAPEQGMVHQARLHLGDRSESVLNAAVSGYGLDQTGLYVKRHLPTWENLEVLVLVVFAGNDMADTASNMRYGHDKPLFRLVDGSLHRSAERLSRYSRRNLVTQSRLVYSFEALYPSFSRLVDDLSGESTLDEEEARVVVRALLADLHQEMKKRNVVTLRVLAPGKADLAAPSASFEWLEDTLRASDVPFLNLRPLLQSEGVEAETLFLPGDPWHLSVEGNRRAGRWIAEAILDLPNPSDETRGERP